MEAKCNFVDLLNLLTVRLNDRTRWMVKPFLKDDKMTLRHKETLKLRVRLNFIEFIFVENKTTMMPKGQKKSIRVRNVEFKSVFSCVCSQLDDLLGSNEIARFSAQPDDKLKTRETFYFFKK
jgi:hypothetical protein